MVQWLGFDAFTAMAVKAVQTLVGELRSCMPQGPGVQKEKERKKREKKRK